MMQSLYAGISGLRNHLIRMDVIGNNIANVNTIGFKAGRVTFKEAMAAVLRGATRPSQEKGGINPMQIGLGMSISSIDNLFTQGSLETTGIITDLAVQGDGFFILRDGETKYYTRAGAFRVDPLGRLVNPEGLIVQGKMADALGMIGSGTAVGDITLPFGQKTAAKATSEIGFTCNLDSRESPLGSIFDSKSLLAIDDGSNDMYGLYAKGNANSTLSLTPGDTVTVQMNSTSATYTYVETDSGGTSDDFHSINDLIAELENDFVGATEPLGGTGDVDIDSNGAITITNNSGGSVTLTITSSNNTLQAALGAESGVTITDGESHTTDEFSHTATGSDLLVDLRDSEGTSLGLIATDVINISGSIGGTGIGAGSFTVTSTSTLTDLSTAIENAFNTSAPAGGDTVAEVTIDSDGSIKVGTEAGAPAQITSVTVNSSNRPTFNTAMTFIQTQQPTSVSHSTSITVYDSQGGGHVVTFTFIKDATTDNTWKWTASVEEPAMVISGYSGRVEFNTDGSLKSFSYDTGGSFKFDPGTGADSPVEISMDPGEIGGFNGITQFASPSTTIASEQDGYGMGTLDSISIGEDGTIVGSFTNGVLRTLAEISLASFNNPSGLLKAGDNLYQETTNSGLPLVGEVGTTIFATISSGALEMSNVDLAQEFVNMIVAQRGFQANARIITTSDDMLRELVNLKR